MGLLDSVIEAAKQQYQTTKRGFGLLASNPQQFAQEATARYFPTKEEEAQFAQAQAAGGDYMQTPYYQKVMNLSQFQGSIKPTGLLNAPQQAALDLAQKNAALPVKQGGLGLPPDNTPMDRAKAMGFDPKQVFHGSAKPFESFDSSLLGSNTGAADATIGHHFAGSKADADLYATMAAEKLQKELTGDGYGASGYIGEYFTRSKNPLIVDDFNSPLLDKFLAYEQAIKNKNDSIVFPYGTNVDSDYTKIIFDPANIRSRNAAFDPFRKDVATATTMGVAAPDLLAAGVPLSLLGTAQQQVNLPKKKKSKK